MSLATARKKVKDEGFNLTDVLSTAAKTKESKSKSKVPVLMVSDEIKGKAARLREIKEELDSLESMYDALSAEVIEKVLPQREILCKQGYVSSVRIPDSKGLSIGISWVDKYCKIVSENELTLRELAGDSFDEYFKTDMTITVKDISEDALTEIVRAVGAERFAQFFEVERTLKPTSRFTNDQFTVFTVLQRQQFAQAGVKQFKPSIKVK